MNKENIALHILRLGLAVTFIWVGILIVRDPEAWTLYIQPWFREILPISPSFLMLVNGIFDIAIGALLLINVLTWPAAILASVHLITILLISGVNDITVRDIGLLGAALALAVTHWPQKYTPSIPFINKSKEDTQEQNIPDTKA